jgi:hypothetical protein
MFIVRLGDNGQVHGARQLRPDAVDVGFADVRVEDLLQHYVAWARRVDRRRRVVVQEVVVQHSLVPRYNARVSDGEPVVVDRGVDV